MTELAFNWDGIIYTLFLLLVANGAPVIAYKVWRNRFAWPVDYGMCLCDGNRLLGHAKTWRGIVFSIILGGCASFGMGFGFKIGMLFGLFTMCGDLLASFIKRRLGLIESSRARGLDTIPESLIPLALLRIPMGLAWSDITVIVIIFLMIEEWVSPILYRLHIRQRPY